MDKRSGIHGFAKYGAQLLAQGECGLIDHEEIKKPKFILAVLGGLMDKRRELGLPQGLIIAWAFAGDSIETIWVINRLRPVRPKAFAKFSR